MDTSRPLERFTSLRKLILHHPVVREPTWAQHRVTVYSRLDASITKSDRLSPLEFAENGKIRTAQSTVLI
jgi:hypothetical protein